MDACPICRASLNGASTCRRCRADLEKVQEVERRGQALLLGAVQRLAAGDIEDAAWWLERAYHVHATPAVRSVCRLVEAVEYREEETPVAAVEQDAPAVPDAAEASEPG